MAIEVVPDTNVLVSALIGSSYPNRVVFECVIGKRIPICLSRATFEEYKDVLTRTKFARFPDFHANAENLLPKLERIAEFHEPTTRLNLIKDEPDNRFLELVITAHANFIVTGNSNDFTFSEYEGVQIVSPKSFYERYC